MSDEGNDAQTARKAFERARRMRNYAIAAVLAFLVLLFFLMTIVQLGEQVGN